MNIYPHQVSAIFSLSTNHIFFLVTRQNPKKNIKPQKNLKKIIIMWKNSFVFVRENERKKERGRGRVQRNTHTQTQNSTWFIAQEFVMQSYGMSVCVYVRYLSRKSGWSLLFSLCIHYTVHVFTFCFFFQWLKFIVRLFTK